MQKLLSIFFEEPTITVYNKQLTTERTNYQTNWYNIKFLWKIIIKQIGVGGGGIFFWTAISGGRDNSNIFSITKFFTNLEKKTFTNF